MPVDEVDTAAVLRVLQQEVEADGQNVRFWEGKTVTAVRVKDRISKVLSWATAMGYRQGDNPAAWDRLQHLLPHKSSVAEEEHQPALPYTRIAEFISALRGREGLAALALEFTILTAARGGQVRFARRREIDWNARVWTAPAENVKGKKGGGREHRVALSEQAITLLKSVLDGREGEPDDFIFPGGKPGKPMSDATLNAVIKRMNEKKVEWVDPKQGNRPVVPHGFRSTFDDYATGVLRFQTEAVEAALAHVVKDKTQAAYKRDDLLDTRFELMQAWANFCDGRAGANVTPFPQASAA
jgi:integrase